MIDLPLIDGSRDEEIKSALEAKTKPPGSLGRLESLALQIARIQGSLQPVMNSCQLTILAGDHGIAAHGVSAYPQIVTRQMLKNFLNGGAASNVLSDSVGVQLQVVDAGVKGRPFKHPKILTRRVAGGTKDFSREPAMTEAQFTRALDEGVLVGRTSLGECVAFGEMGIGNTSSAAMIIHKVSGLGLDFLVGRGTGLNDQGLARKEEVLRRAAGRTGAKLSPAEALRQYGGFEIVMMAGAMLGAASRRKTVLVDGYICSAAALAAVGLNPELSNFLVFSHQSAERGHRHTLELLGATALLNLELRLGEGTGAVLAWPIVKASADMLSKMATFEKAEVTRMLRS